MELCVYAASNGLLVLVPEPCLPPMDAEDAFGPLRLCGRVRADAGSPSWAEILAQIDRHLFATVSADVGATLPGLVPVAQAD